MSLLEVEALNSFYGDSHILFDVSLRVEEHECVALLGRNGAGKTTTLRSIMGVLPPGSGSIRLDGQPIQGRPPYEIARLGMQLVPEERAIFGALTVEENLRLAALTAPNAWPLARIYEVFPRLAERRRSGGRTLSGGEQQMLAIARALIRDARIILLDEPFEGLAPLIVRDLVRVSRELVQQGRTIVVVEQNVAAALSFADRVYVLNNGHMVWDGTPDGTARRSVGDEEPPGGVTRDGRALRGGRAQASVVARASTHATYRAAAGLLPTGVKGLRATAAVPRQGAGSTRPGAARRDRPARSVIAVFDAPRSHPAFNPAGGQPQAQPALPLAAAAQNSAFVRDRHGMPDRRLGQSTQPVPQIRRQRAIRNRRIRRRHMVRPHVRGLRGDSQTHHDRTMIGRPAIQHLCVLAGQPAHHAPVQAERDQPARDMGRLTRSDILQTGQANCSHRIVVAENRRRPMQRPRQVQQLTPVQELPMRQMHIGKGDAGKLDDLRDPQRHPPGHGRNGQRQHVGRGERKRAPHGQAIDPPLQRRMEDMPAHHARQRDNLPRRLLHQQKIGLALLDEGCDIACGRAHKAQ